MDKLRCDTFYSTPKSKRFLYISLLFEFLLCTLSIFYQSVYVSSCNDTIVERIL